MAEILSQFAAVRMKFDTIYNFANGKTHRPTRIHVLDTMLMLTALMTTEYLTLQNKK